MGHWYGTIDLLIFTLCVRVFFLRVLIVYILIGALDSEHLMQAAEAIS